MDREQLNTDVVIVGAGPAGLACAIRLAQLIEGDQKSGNRAALDIENVYVIEKAEELGMHTLSGAVMDPRALRELVPDFTTRGAPVTTNVSSNQLLFLTEQKSFRLPFVPPALRNDGDYTISLSRLVRWLGDQAETAGVNIFTGIAGSRLLTENGRVVGIRTDDKGIGKNGQRKRNFQAGYDLKAKITVCAEGPRGSLTKELISQFDLDSECNPQVYALGLKEIWEIPEQPGSAGKVVHTLGYPFTQGMYGGGWVYGMDNRRISLGLITGLHYRDPSFDPHLALQRFKTHATMQPQLQGGKLLQYGAKAIPVGGYWAIPRCYVSGALIAGDGAGFFNTQRLKGIHLAIKSGMLAAETVFEALNVGDYSEESLQKYQEKIDKSWVYRELWQARNFHQAFERGFWKGIGHVVLQQFSGGRGLYNRYPSRPGHEHLLKGTQNISIDTIDDTLTFDRLTSVYHSGVRHDEDQPIHIRIADPDICHTRCATEYGNPCQYFCPASVFELVERSDGKRLTVNAANCLHCKTCDIMDPYQIITWVPPEGGGGPRYDGT